MTGDTHYGGACAVISHVFGCNESLARIIEIKAHVQNYPPRAVIVEGESVYEHIYLLIDGRARMLAYSIDGRLVAVEDYGRGDLFGENGLFAQETALHDIAAVESSCAAAFANGAFLGLMNNYSCVALTVSRLLVERLSCMTRRLVEGATLSAVGRIHAELLRQARAGEAMTIQPPPVLSAFALLVQSTRETVSRAISTLEKRGIILRDEKGLRVVAPHRLEELIY